MTQHTKVREDVLTGSISLTNITDLIQFIAASSKSGELVLKDIEKAKEGKLYFSKGQLDSVISGKLTGIQALKELITWENGYFIFTPDVVSVVKNMTLPVSHALMEAARLADESRNSSKPSAAEIFADFDEEKIFDDFLQTDKPATAKTVQKPSNYSEPERSNTSNMRESTEILSDLLKVPGIDAVVVAGRDGFIIEAAGSSNRVNIDDLGAAIANTINGIEEMGAELKINRFQDLFIEYGRAVIMCKPVGDAIAAIITPDASKLGIIRHKAKHLFEELSQVF